MSIKLFRILSLLLLARIILTNQFVLILYWVVLIASVELLTKLQKNNKSSRSHILIFFVYLLFITVIRTSGYKASDTITYIINALEHLVFALVISFKISLYLGLYSKHIKQLNKVLLSALAFNIVGFINEIYQNLAKHKPAFIFSPGAKLDLTVNVAGSLLFVLIAYFLYKSRGTLKRVETCKEVAEK